MRACKPLAIAALTATMMLSGAGMATAGEATTPQPTEARGNGVSRTPDVSSYGRYVVFSSTATDLVTGDTNGKEDIFIRDTAYDRTTLVSRGMGGQQSNGVSTEPAVTDDGRYVFFTSSAGNLVPGDTNGATDVFKTDTYTGATTRISVTKTGAQAMGASKRVQINSTGSVIAFVSLAKNLVPGDTNNVQDVFVRGAANSSLKRASTTPSGAQLSVQSFSPSVSFNGKVIGWHSDAFADSAVTAWCGRVRDTLSVISRTTASPTAKPTISEVVCRDSVREQVHEIQANNKGVGYALVSDYGYASFRTRGQGNVIFNDWTADSYAVPSWDTGQWGVVLASTHTSSDHVTIYDEFGLQTELYWSATDISMSPDGSVVALKYVPTGQIYTWNWQTGDIEYISTR